ncbi:MAG: hypothetical protein IPJ82_01200 [Lewinellaceae bacterium]|nr:hypothetical protein [Lewinellaceae bacterium]
MKIILVIALLWCSTLGAVVPLNSLVSTPTPLPVLTENPFIPQHTQKAVRNSGRITATNGRGSGFIEDENGNTVRVSAREIKRGKLAKNKVATFDSKFKAGENHAINVEIK